MLFVQIVLPVFLVIASGYLLEKVSPLDFRTLTNTSLYLFTPALVLSALLKQPLQLHLAGDLFFYMLLYTGVLLALSVLCGRIFRFGDEERRVPGRPLRPRLVAAEDQGHRRGHPDVPQAPDRLPRRAIRHAGARGAG